MATAPEMLLRMWAGLAHGKMAKNAVHRKGIPSKVQLGHAGDPGGVWVSQGLGIKQEGAGQPGEGEAAATPPLQSYSGGCGMHPGFPLCH